MKELFPQEDPIAQKTCRTCFHRQRWCLGPVRVGQYCGVRSSGRTHNGLLKIKVTNRACGFYTEERRYSSPLHGNNSLTKDE